MTDWDFIHNHESVTIQAVGYSLSASRLGRQVIEFYQAVGQWRYLLRDWLSVMTEGQRIFWSFQSGERHGGQVMLTPTKYG